MTIFVLFAVVLLSIVVILAVYARRADDSSATPRNRDTSDAEVQRWVREAMTAAANGRQIVLEIDVALDDPASGPSAVATQALLDNYGRQLATLATEAPTSIDARVCRQLGVRVRYLADHFEAVAAASSDSARPQPGSRRQNDRVTDTLLADVISSIGDLEEHADLL
jgi:hypothetical protein